MHQFLLRRFSQLTEEFPAWLDVSRGVQDMDSNSGIRSRLAIAAAAFTASLAWTEKSVPQMICPSVIFSELRCEGSCLAFMLLSFPARRPLARRGIWLVKAISC